MSACVDTEQVHLEGIAPKEAEVVVGVHLVRDDEEAL
jgi:hypothetical protein